MLPHLKSQFYDYLTINKKIVDFAQAISEAVRPIKPILDDGGKIDRFATLFERIDAFEYLLFLLGFKKMPKKLTIRQITYFEYCLEALIEYAVICVTILRTHKEAGSFLEELLNTRMHSEWDETTVLRLHYQIDYLAKKYQLNGTRVKAENYVLQPLEAQCYIKKAKWQKGTEGYFFLENPTVLYALCRKPFEECCETWERMLSNKEVFVFSNDLVNFSNMYGKCNGLIIGASL